MSRSLPILALLILGFGATTANAQLAPQPIGTTKTIHYVVYVARMSALSGLVWTIVYEADTEAEARRHAQATYPQRQEKSCQSAPDLRFFCIGAIEVTKDITVISSGSDSMGGCGSPCLTKCERPRLFSIFRRCR